MISPLITYNTAQGGYGEISEMPNMDKEKWKIECGNLKGNPLLVFHGGNATTAYNLKYCRFLLNDFHVYAVDTIGHPGKVQRFLYHPGIKIMGNGRLT